MAGLLDFLPPMTVDATNPPTQVMSPQMLGLLGAAAGAAPYMGYSRLPVSGSQILAGMAGGYGRGYLSGLQGIGQAQQNELTGAKTNLYRDLLPTLQGLMGGAPAASPGQSAPPPRPIQTAFGTVAPTPENAQNIGGFMSGQGFPGSAPAGPSGPPVAASPSAAVANAQRVAMLGGFLGMPGLGSAAEMGLKYSPAVQSQIEAAKANVSS